MYKLDSREGQSKSLLPEATKFPTVSEVLVEYLKHRELAARTRNDYEDNLHRCLKDWLDVPINRLSKQDVMAKHRLLSQSGPAQANQAMRILRALFFFAMAKYEDPDGTPLITSNPVKVLSTSRSWNKENIRTNWIPPHEMRAWFKTVLKRPDPWCDYFQLMILTGLRRNEAASLCWDDIDFAAKTLTARETKNGLDHCLPMSDYIYDLLKARHEDACTDGSANALRWVFPSKHRTSKLHKHRGTDENRHFVPHSEGTNIGRYNWSYHDVRRTFMTTAASLDFNTFLIKQLGNHKVTANGDVTYRYIMNDVERLRKPMQMITDEILRQAGLRNRPVAIAQPAASVMPTPVAQASDDVSLEVWQRAKKDRLKQHDDREYAELRQHFINSAKDGVDSFETTAPTRLLDRLVREFSDRFPRLGYSSEFESGTLIYFDRTEVG